MALKKLTDKFKAPALALSLGAASLAGGFYQAAHAEETSAQNISYEVQEQCSPLVETKHGFTMDASYSAWKYSDQNIGAVGISIFPGQDLGQASPHLLGTKLVEVMRLNGIEAKCFVHSETGSNGTAVSFKVAGLSTSERSHNISESLDREVLRGVIAEAKVAGMLLTSTASNDHIPSN